MTGDVRYGTMFPSTEIGNDPADIKRFAIETEAFGFDHLATVDHVVGADPSVHGPLAGPYTNEHPFHEPFVLFGFLAGLCQLEFLTAILVLPQRQTVLAAKQAAELDVLSGGGRLRLGIAIGWNDVEYEALGMTFGNRGRRYEEQIDLMKRLWAENTVTFKGDYHTFTAGSVLPRPVGSQIPLWLGCGKADVALERVGRLADGWMPNAMRQETVVRSWEKVRLAAEAAGRDPDSIGMQGLIRHCTSSDLDRVRSELDWWRDLGATHVAFETCWSGFKSVDEHLTVLHEISEFLYK